MRVYRPWKQFNQATRIKLIRGISGIMDKTKDKVLTHEMIEEAYTIFIDKHATIEDDAFHELITEIYDDYKRLGAVD